MDETITSSLRGAGGRWGIEATARALGFQAHDIATLVRERLLKPLGSPAPNAPKYFPACEVVKLAQDPRWLDRATRAVTGYWARKNQARSQTPKSHQETV